MIIDALILSLQITAIYILFQEGMLLGWLRLWAEGYIDDACVFFCKKLKFQKPLPTGWKYSKYIQKPVWGCVICMASIWTIILTGSINIPEIFLVCGINVLIDKFLNYQG